MVYSLAPVPPGRWKGGIVPAVVGGLAVLFLVAPAISMSPPEPGRLVSALHPDTTPPQEHGALFENLTGPVGFADTGSRLTIELRFEVPAGSTIPPGSLIHVPGTVAQFNTVTGAMHVYLSEANVSVNGTGLVTSSVNVSDRFTSPETFPAHTNATLSSQGFAVTTSWPEGSAKLGAQWRWSLATTDGATTGGGWAPWERIGAAQLAWVVSSSPTSLPVGAPFPICLSGPVGNRTFTIHVTTSVPFETFEGPLASVPQGSGTYCWNTTMPTGVGSQSVTVHLWEYTSTTFLLYQSVVQLSNDSGRGGAPAPVAASPRWFGPAIVGLVAVVLALALVYLLLVRGVRRARPPAAPLGPPPSIDGRSAEPPQGDGSELGGDSEADPDPPTPIGDAPPR